MTGLGRYIRLVGRRGGAGGSGVAATAAARSQQGPMQQTRNRPNVAIRPKVTILTFFR